MIFASQFFGGGAPDYYEEITASKDWQKPEGFTKFFVEVVGGAGSNGNGRVARALFQSTDLPASVAVSVGAAGSAALAPDGSFGVASAGGSSSFGGLLDSSAGVSGGALLSVAAGSTSSGGRIISNFPSGIVRITGWL